MDSGIYIIINKENGKQYVGSAMDVNSRWIRHRSLMRKGKHFNPILQNVWNSSGEDIFEFAVIEECDIGHLIEREQYYLDTLEPEYNIATVANAPMSGRTHSIETRKKLSKISKGHIASDEWKKNMSERMKGNTYGSKTKGSKRGPPSKETIHKIVTARAWYKHSEETKEKMSRSRAGKHWHREDGRNVYE